MKYRWLTTVGLTATVCVFSVAGCSDDDKDMTDNGGSTGLAGSNAGAKTGGTSSGGNASGGKPNGGNASGGTSLAGSLSGGTANGGNTTGGTAAAGGSMVGGAGGAAGAGGADGGSGGDGGVLIEETLLYDFETDAQGWTSDGQGVTIGVSGTQVVTGAQALKATLPELGNDASRMIAIDKPLLWPGTVVKVHVWIPAGTDGLYLQVFSLSNNWAKFDVDGNARPINIVRGGWTTIEYTVPNIFPGGLQRLGIQLGVGQAGASFAGGDIFIDSVTVGGGTQSCEGNDTGTFGFEADVGPWKLDAPQTDTVVTQSTAKAKTGTGSMQVAFAGVPAGTDRIVRIESPTTYCSDQVTVNFWTPLGSDGLTAQLFVQGNNWADFFASPVPTITQGDWTELKFTVPAIGPGGIQALGLLFKNTGAAAFTGNVYVDDVSW
jgi:hypothetical protein